MTLEPESRDRIRRHWADLLGCAPRAFEQAGVTVFERAGRTVRLLRRGDATVVATPERVRGVLTASRSALDDRPLTEAADVIQHAHPGHSAALDTVHGPAILAYVDAAGFSPLASDAQLLAAGDERAFERLRRRVPVDDWQRASPTFRPDRTAGLFRAGELVGVATLGDPPFPDVGVVVDRAHRGVGVGRRVVSTVLNAGFEADSGTVVRYRTLESEPGSLALAASLGFVRWARAAVVVLDCAGRRRD
jgi:RimJ/RimL family protein N-acetyltransferase